MDDNSSGGVDIYELEDGLETYWNVKFSAELMQKQVCVCVCVCFWRSCGQCGEVHALFKLTTTPPLTPPLLTLDPLPSPPRSPGATPAA